MFSVHAQLFIPNTDNTNFSLKNSHDSGTTLSFEKMKVPSDSAETHLSLNEHKKTIKNTL